MKKADLNSIQTQSVRRKLKYFHVARRDLYILKIASIHSQKKKNEKRKTKKQNLLKKEKTRYKINATIIPNLQFRLNNSWRG